MLQRCASPIARRTRGFHSAGIRSPLPAVVDIHSHFLPKEWPDFAARHGGSDWPSMRHVGELPGGTYGYAHQCDAMLMSGKEDFRPVTRAAWDPAARLADLDAAGVDVQLISATPILFQWQRSGAVAADVAAWFNDSALQTCEGTGGRLRALCQVPLQDIDLACRELDRAMAAGHVGVQIGNHVGVKDLDDDGLIAFLAHCAHANAPVFIHPWDMCNPGSQGSSPADHSPLLPGIAALATAR